MSLPLLKELEAKWRWLKCFKTSYLFVLVSLHGSAVEDDNEHDLYEGSETDDEIAEDHCHTVYIFLETVSKLHIFLETESEQTTHLLRNRK